MLPVNMPFQHLVAHKRGPVDCEKWPDDSGRNGRERMWLGVGPIGKKPESENESQ